MRNPRAKPFEPPDRFEAPVPGEALTVEPGRHPYERPPQFTDPEVALDWLFKRLMDPRQVYDVLSLLDGGLPISVLAEIICKQGFTEGKWSQPLQYMLAGPLTVMLYRLSESAGIKPKITAETGSESLVPESMLRMAKNKIDSEQVDRAVDSVRRTRTDLPSDRGAAMTPMITRHSEE